MSKKSRDVVINELNEISQGTLQEKAKVLDNYWLTSFEKYGGQEITTFPDAIKAGEITLSNFSSNNSESVFPKLKAIWNENVTKKTSSYLFVVDNKIAKIGGLKEGVKGNSFSQYLTGVSGSPSRRSCGGYTFLAAMLKNKHKVEIYHVTMDGVIDIETPTINGKRKKPMHFSPYDIEKSNIDEYKKTGDGTAPYLNLKERDATYPREFDVIYDIIHQRIQKTKQYKA